MTVHKHISIIVAMAKNNAIGKNNDLLLHLPGDLKRFKAITSGHAIIMGKKTLYSLPKWPLPDRRHIVMTHEKGSLFPGCETATSIDEVLEKVKGEEEAFVIGGGSVYRQFYPLADRLYLTLIDKEFDGDTFFPEIDFSQWEEISREDLYEQKNGVDYSFINLARK